MGSRNGESVCPGMFKVCLPVRPCESMVTFTPEEVADIQSSLSMNSLGLKLFTRLIDIQRQVEYSLRELLSFVSLVTTKFRIGFSDHLIYTHKFD